VHNGIIVNDAELWKSNPALVREAEVDTEVLLQLIRDGMKHGRDLVRSLRDASSCIVGTVSTAMAFQDLNYLALFTNNGSLYVVTDPENGTTVFASERYILDTFLANSILGGVASFGDVRQLQADELLLVDLTTLALTSIDLATDVEAPFNLSCVQRTISDKTPANVRELSTSNSAPTIINQDFSAYEIDTTPILALKRCQRCILPETVPFIEFDEKGVCNFCNSHVPAEFRGRDELVREAEKLKSQRKPGGADCLFTFSGGRDSSFGLHYAVRELGLKPVTYTYDWGMITDLARRNQARMCGELKVEHILVSADISKKRENIRRNVSAWLKKPMLGMVPLFMAGDKHYFYFANDLGKKLNLETILLASNPLEKTHFKAGFCGVPPTFSHRPSVMSQAKMVGYYGSQILSNPRYVNKSLLDTGSAFASYYFIKHKYLRMFDYIPWVEGDVNNVLLNEYDWETARDTKSTWRIGDGTAAFYNYIYYAVAGFSENDTFRSNQIREGLMHRDEALRLSESENQPRFDSIAWYCKVIDLDVADVLAQIATIPTLYSR